MDFSIVIITHSNSRNKLVLQLVDSILLALKRFSGRCELLVINSSPAKIGFNDEFIREIHVPEAPKASAKRNIGIKQACNEWIILIDDDCIVAEDIFTVFEQNIEKDQGKIAGYFGITEFTGKKTFAFKCCENSYFTGAFEDAKNGDYMLWGATTVACFNKKVLIEVGGFNDRFNVPTGGEDVDLGLKINLAGYKIKGIPQTLIYHDRETWNSFPVNMKRFMGYGMADVNLLQFYPKHFIYKVNNFMTLLLPILMFFAIGWNHLTAALLGSVNYIVLSTLAGGLYFAFNNKIGLLRAIGLTIYERSYEFGASWAAVRWKYPRSLVLRFYYHTKKLILGREKLLYIKELYDVIAIIISAIIFMVLHYSTNI